MEERRKDRTPITDAAVAKQLQFVANESGLTDIVVATDNGLLLAEAATNGRGEMLAAMAGTICELNGRLSAQGGPGDISCYRMRREDGSSICANFFEYEQQKLVLMMVTPPDVKEQQYSKRLVTGVQRILSETNEDILADDNAREKYR